MGAEGRAAWGTRLPAQQRSSGLRTIGQSDSPRLLPRDGHSVQLLRELRSRGVPILLYSAVHKLPDEFQEGCAFLAVRMNCHGYPRPTITLHPHRRIRSPRRHGRAGLAGHRGAAPRKGVPAAHSIISSAPAESPSETSMPSALAVCKFLRGAPWSQLLGDKSRRSCEHARINCLL